MKHKGLKMKDLIKNFINIDTAKLIVSYLNLLRKGALLIILAACFGFLSMEYFLYKIGIIANFFVQFYAIVGFVAGLLLLIKLYNEACTHLDNHKAKKFQKEQYENKVQALSVLLKPILDSLTNSELELLKRFVDEKTLYIVDTNGDRGINRANFIIAKLYSFGLNIEIRGNGFYTLLSIDKFFYDLLCEYFQQD